MNSLISILLVGLLVASANCIPKYEDGGFKPSNAVYADKSAKAHHQDQIALPSQQQSQQSRGASSDDVSRSGNDLNERTQEPRFGFANVGDSTGYGVSSYAPAKIDLGGLLLGAVIGIGSVLVIPKLLYVLSGTYGGYARSDDDEGGVAQVMTKLDDALARHGIDTTTCMQRLACSYSRQAAEAVNGGGGRSDGEASTLDKFVDMFATSPMMRAALRGTAIQEAIETGRSEGGGPSACARAYHRCGFSAERVLGMLATAAANGMALGGGGGGGGEGGAPVSDAKRPAA